MRDYKLGTIVYSTHTGLGYQTRDFYNHMKPDKTLLVDLSQFNGMEQHYDWYPEANVYRGIPDTEACKWLLRDMDAVFVAETPLNYELYRSAGKVRTYQQLNFEFFDYQQRLNLPKPYKLVPGTPWNVDRLEAMDVAPVEVLRVPVDREKLEFREINECKTFIHIIGRPAIHDRNGTLAFLEAASRLPQFNYKVFVQPPTDKRAVEYYEPVEKKLNEVRKKSKMEVITNAETPAEMYSSGDVLVLPRRYGGLCLPMQEALSCGLPVIMTALSPNEFLPDEWLCDAEYKTTFEPKTTVDVYEPSVEDLIRVMAKFSNPDFMKESNKTADELAEKIAWHNMVEEYNAVLAS